MNIAPLGREATLEDLFAVEGNAELVDGRLILMSPSGPEHNNAAGSIYASLKAHQRKFGGGQPYTDGAGFLAPSGRVLSPDAAWHLQPITRTRVVHGFPVLAVEVRSHDDYGPAAERRLAAKREAYFAEGSQVVWDVDVMRENLIRVYRADHPQYAAVYRQGEVAEAEPAVPGWRFPVDELFD
ncbi:MAG TPA: Uma2 family endonuclease [Longimicrobium sp.]|nr:Uma2 family endonuclease [Longimicrobium sp.]